ncbi:unnamed protein product [Phyllotreta striolata]|uniref:Leucine-rich repeat-containing protein 51 n=1 Tax=Phyllotreta striolata TaxID=444603 RepID=A0A9N9TFT4_PHYSR|nr:unnamed protein product [Phyllotreta striolata]
MSLSESKILRSGKPADFSSFHIQHLNVGAFMRDIGLSSARESRVGCRPALGKRRKFLSRSIWLSNNNLRSLSNLDGFVEEILEYPEELGWIDLSFNKIQTIDECILKFKNMKIIYLHGNNISDLEEIKKLQSLDKLKSLTIHGNPIADQSNYRQFVITTLPQVINLDFTAILPSERFPP